MGDGDSLEKTGASDLTQVVVIGMKTRYFECRWA
jgi:hypothetical protein